MVSTCRAPGGSDAGETDAGVDAPGDSPDAAGYLPEVTFHLERGSDCPPWPVAVHPGADAPLAPPGEPYEAWTWSPVGDPAYEGLLRTDGNRLESLSVGADGSITALTPDGTIITRIGHDGSTLWARQVVPTFRDGRVVGPITSSPDGSVYFDILWSPDTPFGFAVWHLDANGDLLDTRRYAEGEDVRVWGQYRQWMSVGPDGSLYYREPETGALVKSCPGRASPAWRLTAEIVGGDASSPSSGVAQADGGMIASLQAGMVRLGRGGDVSWVLPRTSEYTAGGLVMASADVYAVSRAQGTAASGVMFLFDEHWTELWRSPRNRGGDYRLDPGGRLWTLVDPDGGTVRTASGELLWEGDAARTSARHTWGEDGSMLVAEGRVVRRIDGRTGEVLWELAVGNPGDEARVWHLDSDGRLYVGVLGPTDGDLWGLINRIVAVQTDVRAARGVCLGRWEQHWCNRHENYSMWDYGAAE